MAIKSVNWDTFLFRAHYIGVLMTNPKGKSNMDNYLDWKDKYEKYLTEYENIVNKSTKTAQNKEIQVFKAHCQMVKYSKIKDEEILSETCISKLCEIHTAETTGRTRDIKSKYFEKGLAVEERIIDLYSEATNTFFKKNTVRKYNDFVEGELDFENVDTVFDAKASWEIFTFSKNKVKKLDSTYEWQGITYCWLFDKIKARIVYGLINTPEPLVRAEIRRLENGFVGTEEDWIEAVAEVRLLHTYDDIPASKRIKVFDIEPDLSVLIPRIEKRLAACREFLKKLDNDEFIYEEEVEDEN